MLAGLVDRVMRQMRAAHRVSRTVVLRLRFRYFSRAARSHTLARSTAPTDVVLEAARGPARRRRLPLIIERGITLVGIGGRRMDDEVSSPVRPCRSPERRAADARPGPTPTRRGSALDAALDGVRDRFGSAAVTRGVLLRHRPGMEVPLLPD